MSDENVAAEKVNEAQKEGDESGNGPQANNKGGSRKRNRNRKGKKGGGRKGRKSRAQVVETDDPTQVIKDRFAACGRCCYFLGSYVSGHGQEELETAVQNDLSDWLTLTWDHQTRMLVHKAFGVQLDVDYYFYEGCCVACSRQFSFRDNGEDGAVFRVQL